VRLDAFNARYNWPARNLSGQRLKLLLAAHRINLDAPIHQIPREASDAQKRGLPPREEAESHSLHDAGNVEPLGVKLRWHGRCGASAASARLYQTRGGPRLGMRIRPG